MFGDANGSCEGCRWRGEDCPTCLNCFNYGSWESPDEDAELTEQQIKPVEE